MEPSSEVEDGLWGWEEALAPAAGEWSLLTGKWRAGRSLVGKVGRVGKGLEEVGGGGRGQGQEAPLWLTVPESSLSVPLVDLPWARCRLVGRL